MSDKFEEASSPEDWSDSEEPVVNDDHDLGIVIVRLGQAHFAFDVTSVVEVLLLPEATRLFRLPAHIQGVVNLRGRVLPVADLAVLLGVESPPSRVGLMLRFEGREAIFAVGEVKSIEWLSSKRMEEVPSTTSESQRRFFRGVLREAHPIIVLATDRLLAPSTWLARETA